MPYSDIVASVYSLTFAACAVTGAILMRTFNRSLEGALPSISGSDSEEARVLRLKRHLEDDLWHAIQGAEEMLGRGQPWQPRELATAFYLGLMEGIGTQIAVPQPAQPDPRLTNVHDTERYIGREFYRRYLLAGRIMNPKKLGLEGVIELAEKVVAERAKWFS